MNRIAEKTIKTTSILPSLLNFNQPNFLRTFLETHYVKGMQEFLLVKAQAKACAISLL
jgi:hypothetical protein